MSRPLNGPASLTARMALRLERSFGTSAVTLLRMLVEWGAFDQSAPRVVCV